MKDRHVLIAVDQSDFSKKAVMYAADFLGGNPGFRATLIHIVLVPPEDYFESDAARAGWIEEEHSKAEAMLERYRDVLFHSGFEKNKVSTVVDIRHTGSVGDCILDTQKKLGCCTVILGRRGISKKEEFLYGSTSNKVLHSGKNCAVWVIE